MNNKKYILAHSEINRDSVSKNGVTILKNHSSNPQEFLSSIYEHFDLQYPRFYRMDNLSKLGWLASEILLANETIAHKPEDIGVVLSNANSSLDTDIKYFQSADNFPSPALFVYTLPNIVSGEICIRNNFKGENAFFISDSFNPDFIDQYVSILLEKNVVRLCICGWVEFLKDSYRSVLFLAGIGSQSTDKLFTSENLSSIFSNQE